MENPRLTAPRTLVELTKNKIVYFPVLTWAAGTDYFYANVLFILGEDLAQIFLQF